MDFQRNSVLLHAAAVTHFHCNNRISPGSPLRDPSTLPLSSASFAAQYKWADSANTVNNPLNKLVVKQNPPTPCFQNFLSLLALLLAVRSEGNQMNPKSILGQNSQTTHALETRKHPEILRYCCWKKTCVFLFRAGRIRTAAARTHSEFFP